MKTQLDPSKIRIKTSTISIGKIIERIKDNSILFNYNNTWSIDKQSHLIESLLVRIPLPSFCIDASNYEKWVIINGFQRLNSIKCFVLDDSILKQNEQDKLYLTNLEYLDDLNGKTFDTLERHLQRRIETTDVVVYFIDEGVSNDVKLNLYKIFHTDIK